MASKGKAPAGNSGTAAVAELLDGIVKKQTFKQLAGYSIKCLQALLVPTRIGWDIMSRAAFDLNGPVSVLQVLQRYSTDGELLNFGVLALKSMVSAPGTGTPNAETLSLSMSLLNTVWTGAMPDAEKVAAITTMLEYVLLLARKCAAQLPETGIVGLLDGIAAKLASGWASEHTGSLAASLFRLISALAMVRDGLAAVAEHPTLVKNVLAAAIAIFNKHDATISSSLAAVQAAASGASSGGGSAASPAPRVARGSMAVMAAPAAKPGEAGMQAAIASYNAVRGLLEPLLRMLDRLSRVQEGAARLKSVDALSLVLPLADWWLHCGDLSANQVQVASGSTGGGLHRAASFRKGSGGAAATSAAAGPASGGASGPVLPASLLLDLYNRIVEAQAMRLVHIAGGRDAGGGGAGAVAATPDSPARRQQAARLLARLCELPERISSVARDSELLEAVVRLLAEVTPGAAPPEGGAPAAPGSKVAVGAGANGCLIIGTAMCAVLVRVLERGPNGVSPPGAQILMTVGALPAALGALCAAALQPSTVTADAAAAAALRVLYSLLTVSGEWQVDFATGALVTGAVTDDAAAGERTLTSALNYALAFAGGPFAPESFSDAGLQARYATAGAGTRESHPSTEHAPLLVVLLFACSLAVTAVAKPPSSAAEMPAYSTRLATSFYALALLRECVFAVSAPVPGSLATSCGYYGFGVASLHTLIPGLCATLASAAAFYVAAQFNMPGDPGGFSAWLSTGCSALGVELAIAIAANSADTAALLTHGIGRPLNAILQGRDVTAEDYELAAASATAFRAGGGGGGGGGATGGAGGSRGAGGGAGLRRGMSIGSLSASWGAAAMATPLDGAPPDASLRVGLGWLASFSLGEPQWVAGMTGAASGSEGGARAGRGASKAEATANITKPQVLGADALYLAGSVMAYLVAFSQTDGDAALLPEGVVNAIAPLAALADLEAGISPPRDVAARGVQETIRGAVSTALQAALVTFSQFSTDATVYAHFRDMVEVAGVGADEITGALEVLRGCAAVLQPTVLEAPTRSSASAGNTAVMSVLKPLDGHMEGSELLEVEGDAAAVAHTRVAEGLIRGKLAAKAASLGVAKLDYFATVYEVCTLARQKLLLLEAISLSPFLAWGMVSLNGVYPLLRVFHYLTVAMYIHGDVDEKRASGGGGRSGGGGSALNPARVLARVEEVQAHVARTLAHLSRVGFEARASGQYTVLCEELDPIRLPSALDLHLIPATTFTREVTGSVCSGVLSTMAAGHKLRSYVPACAQLMGWLAAIANVVPPRPDPTLEQGWSQRYVATILAQEFVEATVALLRYTMTQLTNAVNAAAAASAGDDEAQATVSSQCEVLLALLLNLQHLAAHKPGANAIATRGASRQILRAIPLLLGLCGSDRASLAYTCLVAVLRVLNAAVAVGGAERNIDDDGSGAGGGGGGSLSVGALLLKQGLMDTLIQVVFSPVGITSAATALSLASYAVFGEACQLALAVASAVSTRRDVMTAVGILYEVCGKVAGGIGEYVEGATEEMNAWYACAGAGGTAASLKDMKRATLQLGELVGRAGGAGGAAGAGADGAGGGGEAEGEEDDSASSSRTLLGAIQLFGILILTEAGRRAGVDTTLQGIAACAALAQSGVTFSTMSARIQDAVLSALSAATASTDESKPAAPLPAALAAAATVALSPPPKAERDVVWSVWLCSMVSRVSVGVLMEMGVSAAAGEGQHDLSYGDALSWLMGTSDFADSSLCSLVDTLISTVEASSGSVFSRISAAASGAAVASAIPKASGPGKLGAGSAAVVAVSVPSADLLLAESTASLALLSRAGGCARRIPSSADSRGVELCLGALAVAAAGGHGDGAGGGGHGGGGGGAAGGAGKPGDASSGPGAAGGAGGGHRAPMIEVVCHVLVTLAGVATAGPDMLPVLSLAGVTSALMRVVGDVISAAVAVGTSTGAGAASSGSGGDAEEGLSAYTLRGTEAAFVVLAALASSGKLECDEMVAGGITSFLRSVLSLCGDDATNTTAPARPVLLKPVTELLDRLASVGRGLLPPDAADAAAADGTVDTPLALGLRDLVVRVFALASNSRQYMDALPCIHAVFTLVLHHGEATHAWVHPAVADRTVVALRADVPKAIPACRRAIANANATPQLVHDGKEVIKLLTGDKEEEAAAGEAEGEAEEEADELLEAVIASYDKLGTLHGMFRELGGAHASAASGEDEEAQGNAMEECMDTLRTLSILLPAYFPSRELDEGGMEERPKRTAATVWQIFCTARDYVTAVHALLADARSHPAGTRLVSALYDITTACMPVMARMSVVAEASRQAMVAAYWAGQSAAWELPPEQDVPMTEAVAGFGQALDAHLIPAQRTVRIAAAGKAGAGGGAGGGGTGGGGGSAAGAGAGAASSPGGPGGGPSPTAGAGGRSGGSGEGEGAAAPYHPQPVAIEQICKGLRNLIGGAGHEAVGALVTSGQVTNILRLIGALRQQRERAVDPQAEGDKEELRRIVADADRCIAALGALVRSVVGKGKTEVEVYCHAPAGSADNTADELRDVVSILPASALAGLLRASALLAVQAGEAVDMDEGDDGDDAEEDKKASSGGGKVKSRAADSVLDGQVRAILAGKRGEEAVFGLMEELGSQTLAAATLAGPLRDLATGLENKVQLKLFNTILTALHEHASARKDFRIPAKMSMLRGLYASVVTAMQVLMGDAMVAATHSSALAALYHDPAVEEFAPEYETRRHDLAVDNWIAPPSALALASSKAEDLPCEEI